MLRRAVPAQAISRVVVPVLMAGLLVAAPRAGASPIDDKRAEATRLQQQLDALNTRISVLDEQYNQAQLKVRRADAAVAQARSRLAATSQKLDGARVALSQQAIDAYVRGAVAVRGGSAVVGTGVADPSIERAYVRLLTSRSAAAIDDLRAARAGAVDARSQVEAAQSDAAAAARRMAETRTSVERAVGAQQAAVGKANGDLAELIRQDEARKAREAAARAAAELAARQAAAAAEARRQAEAAASRARAQVRPVVAAPPPVTDGSRSPVFRAPAPAPASGPAPASAPGAASAIAEARRHIGQPYRWGGAGPDSYDCSGLTMVAWRAGGVVLDHSTYAQWDETTHVSLGDIQPGDLIFYGRDLHHVALYSGGGMMIEAPYTGADVREIAVRYNGISGIGRPG